MMRHQSLRLSYPTTINPGRVHNPESMIIPGTVLLTVLRNVPSDFLSNLFKFLKG